MKSPPARNPLSNPVLGRKFLAVNARLAELVEQLPPLDLEGLRLQAEICHILEAPPQYEQGWHQHACFELSLIQSGLVEYVVEGMPVPVRAGELFLGPPDTRHRWHTQAEPGVIFGFILKAETAPGDDTAAPAGNWLARATRAIGFGCPAPAPATVLFGLLNADLQREDGFLPVATAPLLAAFCHALLRPVVELAHSRRDLDPVPGRSRSERLFRQAVGFLEVNLGNSVDLTTVARYVNLGPRQLNRIFVEQTGAPAGAYLRERRLVRARELLQDGTFRVKEVATACGFTEPAYFCRMFRRRFGASPARFHGQP